MQGQLSFPSTLNAEIFALLQGMMMCCRFNPLCLMFLKIRKNVKVHLILLKMFPALAKIFKLSMCLFTLFRFSS